MEKYYACTEYLQEIGKTHGLGLFALQSLERIRVQRDLISSQGDAKVFTRFRILSVHELQVPDAELSAVSPSGSSSSPYVSSPSDHITSSDALDDLFDNLDAAAQTIDETAPADDIQLADSSFLLRSSQEMIFT